MIEQGNNKILMKPSSRKNNLYALIPEKEVLQSEYPGPGSYNTHKKRNHFDEKTCLVSMSKPPCYAIPKGNQRFNQYKRDSNLSPGPIYDTNDSAIKMMKSNGNTCFGKKERSINA